HPGARVALDPEAEPSQRPPEEPVQRLCRGDVGLAPLGPRADDFVDCLPERASVAERAIRARWIPAGGATEPPRRRLAQDARLLPPLHQVAIATQTLIGALRFGPRDRIGKVEAGAPTAPFAGCVLCRLRAHPLAPP